MPFMPFTPMLCNSIDLADLVTYIEDDDWAFEQKVDGDHMGVAVDNGTATGINRQGGRVELPRHITQVFAQMRGRWIFDGELVWKGANAVLWLWDLPFVSGKINPGDPWVERRAKLEAVYATAPPTTAVRLLPCATTHAEKARLAMTVLGNMAEGLVIKRKRAPYLEGSDGRGRERRSDDCLKAKYVKDVDCWISAAGIDGKHNFQLSVYDDDGIPVVIGEVSALTGDGKRGLLNVGDVCTVTYLTWTGTRLREPVSPRRRHDKSPRECLLNQLRIGQTKIVLIN